MITIESIRHKLHLITDQMVDVAHDMQFIDNLEYVVNDLLATSEALSIVAETLPKALPTEPYQIDLGDQVYHTPSKQTFIVRSTQDGCITSFDKPTTIVFLKHCWLIHKATPEERRALQHQLDTASATA